MVVTLCVCQVSVLALFCNENLSFHSIYRGSYRSAHVLLNLLNELGKSDRCEACRAFDIFFATNLIDSIIQ